ncbi:MAG: HEAT repeat domain-containing protein, partial [Cyanobacteria bacterium P01_H01_bin.121]
DAQLAEYAEPAPLGMTTPAELQTPSISAESPITTPPSARVATPADGSQASSSPTPAAPSTFAAVPTPSTATTRNRSVAELTPLQLAAAVRHPDAAYRQRLAIALLESLPEQSPQAARNYVRPLIQLSRDPDVRVRKAAFAALGKVPSKTILPALRRGLRDADSDVVKVANQSMRRFRGVLKTEPKGRAKTRTKRLPRNARPHV